MTIQIPVRFLLFLLYTVAVLGAAFGISYAVFEWRNDEGAVTGLTLESLDERIERVDGRVDRMSSRVGDLSTSIGGSADSRECHAAILNLIMLVLQAQAGEISGSALEQELVELEAQWNAHC